MFTYKQVHDIIKQYLYHEGVFIVNQSSKVSSVDFFKLLFSLCVVALHTENAFMLSENANYYVTSLLFRLAVPYFFIASGYFLGKKLNKSGNKTSIEKQYISRNAPYWLFYGSLYGLVVLAKDLSNGSEPINSILSFFKYMIFYPRGAMWFILASIVASIIIVALFKHKRLLFSIAIIGYVFALICNTYYFTISNTPINAIVLNYLDIFISARNGIFIGIPLLGLGIYLSSDNNCIRNKSNQVLYIALIIEFIILLLEVIFVKDKLHKDDSSLFIILPFLTTTLFELSLRIKLNYNMELSKSFRQLSSYIYFIHPLLGFVINEKILHILSMDGWNIVLYSLKIAICFLLFIIFRKTNNPILKKILP